MQALCQLAGAPQVNLPGAVVDGAPVGLSVIGPHGSDLELMLVAPRFAEAMQAE